MTIALVGLGFAFVAIIGEIIAEFVFEILGQLLFELVAEGCRQLFGPGRRTAARKLTPSTGARDSTRTGVGPAMWVAAIAIGAAFGFWRGNRADTVSWGFGLAVVVVIVAVIAAQRPPRRTRPDSQWRRLLFWWPSERLYWFAAANGSFVAAYLVAYLLARST